MKGELDIPLWADKNSVGYTGKSLESTSMNPTASPFKGNGDSINEEKQ